MSHQSSELELSPGVNVLTGPNNSGKSAVVSALQLLAELPAREGTYMIRHGESESQVIVETAAGDEIIWGRKQASSYLIINGEKHTRISNNQEHFLNELHKILKLPQVKNKEETFDIHFASQKQPIFLLDEPPSRAATFFSISSDAGRLVEVRDLFKNKVNKAKEKRGVLTRKQASLVTELERLKPLQEIKAQVESLKTEFDGFEREEGRIGAGFKLLEAYKKRLEEHGHLFLTCTLYKQLPAPPTFESFSDLEKLITAIRSLNARRIKLEQQLSILIELTPLPDQESTVALSTVSQTIKYQDAKKNNLLKRHQVFEQLTLVPKEEDPQLLQNTIFSLFSLSRKTLQKRTTGKVLSQLLSPPVPQDFSLVERTFQDLLTTHVQLRLYQQRWNTLFLLDTPPNIDSPVSLEEDLKSHRVYQKKIQTLSSRFKEVSSSLSKWISDNPSCPTCGAALSAEHLSGDFRHA